MAWELPLFKPGGIKAGADLSAKQFFCMKLTANNQVDVQTTDGGNVVGILQDKPNASGIEAQVMFAGFSKALVGTTVAAGDKWTVDTAGKIRPVVMTDSGADVIKQWHGDVIEGAAAGEYATVSIGLSNGMVPFST